MTNAIRYGKLETITTDGITTTSHTETIHDYTPTNQFTKTTVNVFADSRKKLLAEVLKLTDKLNENDVTEIAFECSKRNTGSPYKMCMSWVSK